MVRERQKDIVSRRYRVCKNSAWASLLKVSCARFMSNIRIFSKKHVGACVPGDYEIENEWSIINGMRRDAKLSTVEDGGSRETARLELASTVTAGGVPDNAEMRLFFKYEGEYKRCVCVSVCACVFLLLQHRPRARVCVCLSCFFKASTALANARACCAGETCVAATYSVEPL